MRGDLDDVWGRMPDLFWPPCPFFPSCLFVTALSSPVQLSSHVLVTLSVVLPPLHHSRVLLCCASCASCASCRLLFPSVFSVKVCFLCFLLAPVALVLRAFYIVNLLLVPLNSLTHSYYPNIL